MATLHAVAHQVLDRVVGGDHAVPDAVPDGDPNADQVGMSISEAARRLGVSRDAMRQRIRRGTVRSAKVDGAWIVYLDGPGMVTGDGGRSDGAGTQPRTEGTDADQDATRTELIDQLRGEVAWLRQRLEEAETERAEMRWLLAHAQQTQAARALPPPAYAPTPTPVPRPPWWRRLFRAG